MSNMKKEGRIWWKVKEGKACENIQRQYQWKAGVSNNEER